VTVHAGLHHHHRLHGGTSSAARASEEGVHLLSVDSLYPF
jgi:hypothetical protein